MTRIIWRQKSKGYLTWCTIQKRRSNSLIVVWFVNQDVFGFSPSIREGPHSPRPPLGGTASPRHRGKEPLEGLGKACRQLLLSPWHRPLMGNPTRRGLCGFFCRMGKRDRDAVAPKRHLGSQSLMSTTSFRGRVISELIDTVSIIISVCPQVKVCVFKKAVTDLINYCNCYL